MATLVGAFDSWSAWWSYVSLSLKRQEEMASWSDQYRVLKAYYQNNGVYEVIDKLYAGVGAKSQDMRPLRNPAFRVVEFYAAKIWPGPLPDALPIVSPNAALTAPLQQVWAWSNWGSEKQAAARWFAMYGDMFLKVATKRADDGGTTRVYLQNIEPIYVTEMDSDERGILTYVRFDIPRQRRTGDKTVDYTHTEVWNKGEYRLWEHTRSTKTPTDQLGAPTTSAPLSSFGIDFIPVVWQPFRNIGDERGSGAFTPVIEKIDEANRQATRLHQMLFRYNRALWAASANGVDATGRPLPPPRLGDSGADTLEVDDDTVLRLPGNSTLSSLVAPIDYGSALAILDAQLAEIQKDLPELAYYELRSLGVSGIAAITLLGDAIDRAVEARGNAEAALVRANQMALTIGQNLGLFADLGGTYEDGAFAHSFVTRPVMALPENDKAALVGAWVQAGVPLTTALRRVGWSEEQLTQLDADRQIEALAQRSTAEVMLTAAERDFNAGEGLGMGAGRGGGRGRMAGEGDERGGNGAMMRRRNGANPQAA